MLLFRRDNLTVSQRSSFHSVVAVPLLLLVFLGQGPIWRGTAILLSPDRLACCLNEHHCPLSYTPNPQSHSAHGHRQHAGSPAKPRCELRACPHQNSFAHSADSPLRFLLPLPTAILAPEADFSISKKPALLLAQIVFSPPDPPPRPSVVVAL